MPRFPASLYSSTKVCLGLQLPCLLLTSHPEFRTLMGKKGNYLLDGPPQTPTVRNNSRDVYTQSETCFSVDQTVQRELISNPGTSAPTPGILPASPSTFQSLDERVISNQNLQFHHIKDRRTALCPQLLLNPFVAHLLL